MAPETIGSSTPDINSRASADIREGDYAGPSSISNSGPDQPLKPITPEYREVVASLSRSIIRTTAGYDAVLRAQNMPSIIECYAYRPRPYEVDTQITREEAIAKFAEHARKIDEIGLKKLPSEWIYIRDSQLGLAAYLREQDRLAKGEPKTPYDEFLTIVSGYAPRMIPREYQQKTLEEITEVLASMGERFNPNDYESIRRAIRKRHEDGKLNSQDAVERVLRRADRRNRSELAKLLGPEVHSVKFQLEWEEANVFWRFYEDMSSGGENILRANWHERHRESYDIGLADMYGGHEPEHFIIGHHIARAVKKGEIDPAAGLLTIPGPTGFQMEGLAQTIGDIAEYDVTQDGRLAVLLYRLDKYDIVNGLFRAEQGEPTEEIVQDREFNFRGIDERRRTLRDGLRNPFDRAFLPNYGRSDYAIMQIQERVGSVKAFIPYWHSRPLVSQQFINPPLEHLVRF
ncbi:MAG: hypothetical protein Q8P25_02340 [Candidatus Curtissbacteria bacterium]|nr:hypothetical protein [Candidatus Curtissbacteria bacterium]